MSCQGLVYPEQFCELTVNLSKETLNLSRLNRDCSTFSFVTQSIEFWNQLIKELKLWASFLDNLNSPALEIATHWKIPVLTYYQILFKPTCNYAKYICLKISEKFWENTPMANSDATPKKYRLKSWGLDCKKKGAADCREAALNRSPLVFEASSVDYITGYKLRKRPKKEAGLLGGRRSGGNAYNGSYRLAPSFRGFSINSFYGRLSIGSAYTHVAL